MQLPVLQIIYQADSGSFHAGEYALLRSVLRDGYKQWSFISSLPGYADLSFEGLPSGVFCGGREFVQKPGLWNRLKKEKVWRNCPIKMDVDWAKYGFEVFEDGFVMQMCVIDMELSAHKLMRLSQVLQESNDEILNLCNRYRKKEEHYTSVVARNISIKESDESRELNKPFNGGPMFII